MAEANRRRKQPDVVRTDLLRAAIDIAAESGMAAVTLEAVSARAGVTRGALHHHFPGRQGLRDAMFAEMQDRFMARAEDAISSDPVEAGRDTRAFVRTMTTRPERTGEDNVVRALLAMLISEPQSDECWTDRWTEAGASPEEEARLAMCRMAASGVMMSDLVERKALPPGLRERVVAAIVAQTYGPAGTAAAAEDHIDRPA